MPIMPRNEFEDPAPEEGIHAGDVARRYEITLEREFLAIRSNTPQNSRVHWLECGREVLTEISSTGGTEPGYEDNSGNHSENHSIFSILTGFLHFRRARFPKRQRSGRGGNDDVSS